MRTLIALLMTTTAANAEWKALNKFFGLGVLDNKVCLVKTAYQKTGIELILRAHADWKGFDLMVCNKKWRVTEDKEYGGTIYVDDGNYKFGLKGSTDGCFFSTGWWNWDHELYTDLGGKKSFKMTINGKPIDDKQMKLNGSKEALWALKQCHSKLSGETFPNGDTF